MTAPSLNPEPAPRTGLDGPESRQNPVSGTERRPGGVFGPQTGAESLDFDGCHRDCRRKGAHTLRWGGCEYAPKPEPTVSMSVVYQDTDGYPSIGFDRYTVPELARLIEPTIGDPLKAAAAARAIIHRRDVEATEEHARTTPDNPATSGDAAGNCCVCGGGHVVYRNYQEQPFCGPCANCPCGETPCVRTGINDPAVSGDAALRTALAEALAYLHALTRVGGSVIGYQTVNDIPEASYDRWCAVRDAGTERAGEQP